MDSEDNQPPQYPWKAEGPLFQQNPTASVSATDQPRMFFEHLRINRCCARCRTIVQGYPKNREMQWDFMHYDFKVLRASASRGCPVCGFFYHEVALQPHLQNLEQNQLKMEVLCHGETIDVIDFSSTSRRFEIYHRRDGIQESDAESFSTFRDVQPHPLSEDCWKIAVDWISTFIDVSGPRPRLVDGGSNSGPYTALSHCWGQLHRPLSYTTSHTLDDFRLGIDLLDHPATFRDAIEVTRRLKISYLWIDSLCIVQDDVEDWQKEARLMGSYYQNCFLNISALDAPDSDTGFLIPRQTYATVQLEDNYHLRSARRTWRSVFQDSPLSRRAWVLQERLVSTRVLHYGKDDMFWECLTCSTRESDTRQHRLTDQEAEGLDENFKRSLLYSGLEDAAGRKKAIRKWYKVVEQYSRLAMSHYSDMLLAISGIAERIKQATGFDFIAGIWIEDMKQGLLWVADGPKSVPRIWRAPSWSWAQLTGPVHHLFGLRSERVPGKYDVKLFGASVSGQGDNTLSDARLSVIGYTSLVWTKSSHGNPPYNNPSLKLILDIFDQQGLPVGTGHLDTFMEGNTVRQCEALAISERLDLDVADKPWLLFLLIEPVEGKANVYRRIGIGQELEPFHLNHLGGRRVFDQQPPRRITLI